MNIGDFIKYDLWRITTDELGKGKKILFSILKTVILVVRGFIDKELNIRANALTYSLMFAIVPILAMVLAIAKGFGFDAIIQDKLNSSFLAETNIVPTIMEFVDRYLATAQGGAFIGVGLVILLVAVYTFFRQAEMAFNGIWNVSKTRNILRQLTTYIAILFFIPVFIIVTSGISVFFNSASTTLPFLTFLENFRAGFIRFMQFAMVWACFTLMYWGIPNTKVRFLSALIPGILIGSLFQAMQMLGVYILVWLSRTSIVYGAFASIPILLMFLQWTCLMILMGAEMSFAIQNNEDFNYEHDLERMSRRYKDFVTLYILSMIIRRYNNGETALTAHEIARQEHLPVRLVNQLTSRLLEIKILNPTWVENKEDPGLIPARGTQTITVSMVSDCIDRQGTEAFISNPSDEMLAFWERFLALRDKKNKVNDILVSEI
ncbi:MAG: YihY/virulence factor BrkB family protein [Paludibacteraceae bacterium]|nr:YihY/virulence factor BrkB family protein [Paludibacteraceae bacterium]